MNSILFNSQIQNDLTATSLNLHCDPRTIGPKGTSLDMKSKAGKIAVEDDICNLTVPKLTTSGSSTGGGGVTQIVAGTNVTISSTPTPGSGTGVVTINSTGGGGGALPAATTFGEYLYYNDNTPEWEVGGDKINIGSNAGKTPVAGETNQIAIGKSAGKAGQNNGAIAIGFEAALTGGQGFEAIAIGVTAGENNQGPQSVAIGFGAGQGPTNAAGLKCCGYWNLSWKRRARNPSSGHSYTGGTDKSTTRGSGYRFVKRVIVVKVSTQWL